MECTHTHKKRPPPCFLPLVISFPDSSPRVLISISMSQYIMQSLWTYCSPDLLHTCCPGISVYHNPRSLPVFTLLISYYLNLRFLFIYSLVWTVHTTQKLPEKKSTGSNSFEISHVWKTLSSPSYLVNQWVEACQLSGFSMRCSTGLIRQTPDTNIMNGSSFFLLFPFPPPLLPPPLSPLPPFPPLFLLLLPETFSRARTLWFACLFLSGA